MNIVLGAGLAGLTAGYCLSRAGQPVLVVEKGTEVGGLARTVEHNGFRFDLGGHRFLTDERSVMALMNELFPERLPTVGRRSQIHLQGRFIDYPLRPCNAALGLGLSTTARIIIDYWWQRALARWRPAAIVSLEDWVVSHFGRTMFEIYFKQYSEKVWGLPCQEISSDWVAQRIDGLSLGAAIRNAFGRGQGRQRCKTLTDSFAYPRSGIGEIAQRLAASLSRDSLACNTEVTAVDHDGERVRAVRVRRNGAAEVLAVENCLSTIPLPLLLRKMNPLPPLAVLRAAKRIDYRALLVVVLMLDRERVSDQTWIYLPDAQIPFGRIHEPKNWSREMAPAGRTHLVVEFFCSQGDAIWQSTDGALVQTSVGHLERLGFFGAGEVIDSCVLRIPHAYPVFSTTYRDHIETINRYLARFVNLRLVGRTGGYRYLNMDQAMASGMQAVDELLARPGAETLPRRPAVPAPAAGQGEIRCAAP